MTRGFLPPIYFDDVCTLLGVIQHRQLQRPGQHRQQSWPPRASPTALAPGERCRPARAKASSADGGSLSLVNEPMPLTPVPLPAAGPRLLLGVVDLGRFIRAQAELRPSNSSAAALEVAHLRVAHVVCRENNLAPNPLKIPLLRPTARTSRSGDPFSSLELCRALRSRASRLPSREYLWYFWPPFRRC